MCHNASLGRDNFQAPAPDEFWVVSLQETAIIDTPLPHSRHHYAASHVTAVLPFSLSRIHVLPVLCATWHGPVSVALYIPMIDGKVYLSHHPLHGASLDAVEQHMRNEIAGLPGTLGFFAQPPHTFCFLHTGHCSVRLVMAVEHLPNNQTLLEEDWYTIPINALRNIALRHAATEARTNTWYTCYHHSSSHLQVVMLLDGDFVPGPANLHMHLRHSVLPALRDEMEEQGTLLVIPAFDCHVPWERGADGLPTFPTSQHNDLLRHMLINGSATPGGKDAVLAAMETGDVTVFQADYHKCTDYEKWRTAHEPYYVNGHKDV